MTMSTKITAIEVPLAERAAYTPKECAGLFGKAETWGYRRIYDGTFKPRRIGGRMMIPRSQVEMILAKEDAK